jgi:hypothetical protein
VSVVHAASLLCCLIDAAHSIPAARAGCGDDANDVGRTGRPERETGGDHEQVFGVAHQPLAEGGAARVPEDEIKVVGRLLHHGLVVAKHVLFGNSVTVRPCLGELWVHPPRQGELSACLLEWTEGKDGDSGAVLGGTKDGAAAEGERHDRLGGNHLGDRACGVDNCGGCRLRGLGHVLVQVRAIVLVTFDSVDDPLLHGHRLLGELACGTFRGKHDRVSAVVDGGCHIACFGTAFARGRWA